MTTSILYRRRAEQFAELLDEPAGHGPRHRLRSRSDAELSALVALGERTAAVRLRPTAEPDPGFRAELRAMLVATVEREGVGPSVRAPARRTGRRVLAGPGGRARGAIIAGVAAGALVLSGIAAASEDAMPGDALYGVKRSTERAELAFAGSNLGRGQLYLAFARTRLAEAAAVSGSAASFAQVLADMDAHTRQGVKLLTTVAVDRQDPAALDAVDTFVRAQQGDVGDVLDKVGGASRTRLLSSLGLLEEVVTRSQRLRQTLTCGISASNGSDVLGPRPGSCSPGSSPAATRPSRQRTTRPRPTRGPRGGTTDQTAGPDTPKPTATAAAQPAVAGGTGQPPLSSQTPTPTPTPGESGGLLGGLSRIIHDLLSG